MSDDKSIGLDLIELMKDEVRDLGHEDIKEQSKHLAALEALVRVARLKIK